VTEPPSRSLPDIYAVAVAAPCIYGASAWIGVKHTMARVWADIRGGGRLSALAPPVKPRDQIRFAAAQAELLSELAGIGAAPGSVDRLIETLRSASKFKLIHTCGEPRMSLGDTLDPVPRLYARRRRQIQFAAQGRKLSFHDDAPFSAAARRAERKQGEGQTQGAEQSAGDADNQIDIHDHVRRTRR
jgi:hypothetical protein